MSSPNFDLFEKSDGAATIAAVDKVSVDPANAMPVPATLGLLLIGLAAAFVGRNQGRVSLQSSSASARYRILWHGVRHMRGKFMTSDEEGLSLDRDWAMAVLVRTLRWASDELACGEGEGEGER